MKFANIVLLALTILSQAAFACDCERAAQFVEKAGIQTERKHQLCYCANICDRKRYASLVNAIEERISCPKPVALQAAPRPPVKFVLRPSKVSGRPIEAAVIGSQKREISVSDLLSY